VAAEVVESPQQFQNTCGEIVRAIAIVIDSAPADSRKIMRIPNGPEVGQQITIDATEPGGLLNRCRLSILNVDLAPAGEAARIEFEHDKKSAFETRRVYSVQSVRRVNSELVLLENFIADSPKTVREADFREIASSTYARATVLKSLEDWIRFYTWQLQEAGNK
jgi:hypothetical protein